VASLQEVRLGFELDDGARIVLVNRVQVQQGIINLIRNAFEAMGLSMTT
jgi:C4-dicarboxylate-specific signal transduction histidine kinase